MYGPYNKHRSNSDITDSSLCRAGMEEQETAAYILLTINLFTINYL